MHSFLLNLTRSREKTQWLPRTAFWRRPDKAEADEGAKEQFETVMRSLGLYETKEGNDEGKEGEEDNINENAPPIDQPPGRK